MEYIPKKWKDPDTGKEYKLQVEDLPRPATFIYVPKATVDGHALPHGELQIGLLPKEERFNAATHVNERVEGTGCIIKFRGGHLTVTNSTILKLLMESDAYLRGEVQINPEDPTGFWQQSGLVKVKEVKTFELDLQGHPGFDKLDLKKIKAPVEGEEVKPLAKVV